MALSAKKVADPCFRLFQKQALLFSSPLKRTTFIPLPDSPDSNPYPLSRGRKDSWVRVRKTPDSFLHYFGPNIYTHTKNTTRVKIKVGAFFGMER